MCRTLHAFTPNPTYGDPCFGPQGNLAWAKSYTARYLGPDTAGLAVRCTTTQKAAITESEALRGKRQGRLCQGKDQDNREASGIFAYFRENKRGWRKPRDCFREEGVAVRM